MNEPIMRDMNPDSGSGAGTQGIATSAELAAVREARGWSIQEAAQRMRLAVRQIEAMEKGHWNKLPGGTFIRGALRGYGRMLGVGVEPLIETLGPAGEPSDLRSAASLSAPMPRADGLDFSGASGSRRNWVLLALVIVAALAAFALFFGRSTPVGQKSGMAPGSVPASGPIGVPTDGAASSSSSASGGQSDSQNGVQSGARSGSPSNSSPTGPTVIESVPAQNFR
jgi:cytoskeleton protein RodZ